MIKLQDSVSRIIWVSAVLIAALFIFTRLYNLENSLLFFGDLGRDFFVLRKWELSGVPPLLGPQTSALPFNQSSVYFYLQYPAYLISNGSELSTAYTLVVVYIIAFFCGLYIFRKEPKLQISLLVIAALFTIHPQMIIQQRYVWNPSYVPLFLVTSLFSYFNLLTKWNRASVLVFGTSLAAAVSFSYSAAPVLLTILVASFFWFRWKKAVLLILSTIGGGVILNASTIVFELRHNFVLTNMMLHREKLPQEGIDLVTKLSNLSNYIFTANLSSQVLGLLIVVIALTIGWFVNQKQPTTRNLFSRVLLMSISILVLTLLMPVSLHSHYIFGIFTFFAVALALLPTQLSVFILLLLSSLWFTPRAVNSYFQPALRTLAETQQCATQVCALQSDPVFVSTQAGFHPYHNGFEWLYQFSKGGCTVHEIDFEPTAANTMLVVIDDSSYEHGKTSFNELTLFGEATESAVIRCSSEVQVHVLER